jgi:hypothetical protein
MDPLETLIDRISKKHKSTLLRLLKQRKADLQDIARDMESKKSVTKKMARHKLARFLGIPPDKMRLKKMTPVIAAPSHNIPLLDLMQDREQFQTLRKLVLVNKQFNKAFTKALERNKHIIKTIVSLCHFFDLTRKYPTNDFQKSVGLSFVLDTQKIRKEYRIFLENKHFHLMIHDYSKKTDYIQDRVFPDTKEGFIELLDRFVPILKESVFGIDPYWKYLRPITVFDKKMLRRFHVVMDETLKKDTQQNTLFKINPEAITYWDMTYLNDLSDDSY